MLLELRLIVLVFRLTRVLLSQGIHLRDYEVTDRGFSFKTRTLNAEIDIDR